ncbi:MAG: SRPBCC family protein [Microbacterium gubbeenense]|uniref:SRPBCC family protein n=1 Tax=Microbacterium gubbeenense TaxID=159896 RepID=UPI003F98093E
MPITSVDTDHDNLTLTIVADFAASKERLWAAYADPRLVEQFWGPETYPARFSRHDMHPGGQSRYEMVGPAGEKSRGYWEFLSVDRPNSFEVLDGFAGDDGEPDSDMPRMRIVFAFEETAEGSRLTATTHFNSLAELEQLVGMGMIEGTKSAMSQIDAVLADLTTLAADLPAHAQQLSDTAVRISRVIRGSVSDVWRAHHDADLLRRWQPGPDGWEVTECIPPAEAGTVYRFRWETTAGEACTISGEVRQSEPENRIVQSERMDGIPSETIDEMTLTPVAGGTLVSHVVTYASTQERDVALASRMTDGMEAGYARLEEILA